MEERHMAAMTGSHEQRETHDLIGSDKVEGTNVFRSNGEKIGEIERVMLEKRSGRIAYAVMSFGGFLGMGHDHYPIPWPRLTYNEGLGGYEVNISEQELTGAPKYGNTEWSWDQDQGRKVYDYYKVEPYWK
jgi:PRC-barrel domain